MMVNNLTCPKCGSSCPEPINYDPSSRFNSWSCECGCGLTCFGNSSEEAADCWRSEIQKRIDAMEV